MKQAELKAAELKLATEAAEKAATEVEVQKSLRGSETGRTKNCNPSWINRSRKAYV